MNMVRKDTATQDHDNKISSEDLDPKVLGIAKNKLIHFKIDGWNTGYDGHFLRYNVFLNDDVNDFTWSHDNADRHNKIAHAYNIVIHELGHTIGLCDTYKSTTYKSGSCTGVIDKTSIMSNSHVYQDAERQLSATDITTINGAY